MGVEASTRDGRGAVLVQEARVRLEGREPSAVDVEDLDRMMGGASIIPTSSC